MRLKKLLVMIPFIGVVFAGCIGEDRSNCSTEESVELIFTYSTAQDTRITDIITSVDVLLFDEDSYYNQQKRAEQGDLAVFEGMKLTLKPGKYYAVAWANVGEHSSFSDLTPAVMLFSECYLVITEDATDTGGDPIYYAPYKEKQGSRSGTATRMELAMYEIDVQLGKKTVKTLDFVKAHRTTNVWIKGIPEQSGGQPLHPTVKATDLWSQYDFYFIPQSLRRDYSQQAQEAIVEGVAYSKATFYSAIGDINGITQIYVNRTSDNMLLQSANLKQFVEDNNITNTDDIDILFTFMDTGVTITVPQWTEKPVQPGTN